MIVSTLLSDTLHHECEENPAFARDSAEIRGSLAVRESEHGPNGHLACDRESQTFVIAAVIAMDVDRPSRPGKLGPSAREDGSMCEAASPREERNEARGWKCVRKRKREGRGRPSWDIRALSATHSAWTGFRLQNPAARSSSRSRSTAAGECSCLFSLKREGTSWRWRATVRLATMAAMATRLTPKVRIAPPAWRMGRGASGEAPRTIRARCVPISPSSQ